MKLIYGFFPILFFITTINLANAEWENVAYIEDKDHFIVSAFYVRVDSINDLGNNIRSAWTHSHIRVGLPIEKNRDATDIAALYEFDCAKKLFRVRESIFFYQDNTQEKVNPNAKWASLDRDTTKMVFERVCRKR